MGMMVRPTAGPMVVLGDATLDLTASFDRWPRPGCAGLVRSPLVAPGGTGLNVAIGLTRLGVQAEFIGRFSHDDFGRYLRRTCGREEVITKISVPSDYPTRIVLSKVTKKGVPAFLAFHKPAADDDLPASLIKAGWIRRASVLFVTGLTLRFQPSRGAALHAMKIAKEAAVTIVLDPNIRAPDWRIDAGYRAALARALRVTDIFLPNNFEESVVQRELAVPERIIKVVKRGERGCRLQTNEAVIDIPTMVLKVVDVTGAGDAFNAGFLLGLHEGLSLQDACRLANAVAALNCTALGASPGLPRREVLAPYLASLRSV